MNLAKSGRKDISYTKITAIFLFILMIVLLFMDQRWLKGDIIAWDIWSYYSYLPVTFLEQDLTMSFMEEHPEYVQKRYWPVQAPNGNWVIKTSMGMAIIYLPFFLIAHLWASIHSGMEANGFSQPYQIMIALSGTVSMLIGLLALRKVLLTYFTETVSALTMLLIILGTNAGSYVYNEGAMSHIHNFMLFSLFLRLTQLWHESPTWKRTVQLGFLSGFIALVRPNNVVIGLVFILYNVYSLETLKQKIALFWQKRTHFVLLAVLAFSVWIPQLSYWKYVTGHWFFHSYVNEGFFFSNPRIYLGLFSYTKGWFVYTPLAVFGMFGLFLVWRKAKAFAFAAPMFMLLHIYVVLSWWCWWYGGGHSQRALIDAYPILAIGLASFISWAFQAKIGKILTIPALSFLLFLSVFQTWQYRFTLIHWDSMTKELYWKVFLKTKRPADYDKYLRTVDIETAQKGGLKYWGDK